MSDTPIPWIGLAAVIAMFLLPFLPEWVFHGPRTIKHRPRRHVCSDCGAPWTDDHSCAVVSSDVDPLVHVELRRLQPPTTTVTGDLRNKAPLVLRMDKE
jgi:hypothetical protein